VLFKNFGGQKQKKHRKKRVAVDWVTRKEELCLFFSFFFSILI